MKKLKSKKVLNDVKYRLLVNTLFIRNILKNERKIIKNYNQETCRQNLLKIDNAFNDFASWVSVTKKKIYIQKNHHSYEHLDKK